MHTEPEPPVALPTQRLRLHRHDTSAELAVSSLGPQGDGARPEGSTH
jgi:hypothetical protein